MNNYKIKFKNGRTTTICCSSNEELKSDLIDCTKRFNSEIATINDMPTEKLSVGGFLVGTFLGGVLGNAVAKSGVKKTAKTISKTTKKTISKTRKGVSEFRTASSKSKKFSGGGLGKPTYIPNEDIENIKTNYGQTISGRKLLDGAYATGKVKKPTMSRTQFEDESFEYATGGKIGDDIYAYFAHNYMGYQLVESAVMGEVYDGKIIDVITENNTKKYVLKFENGETKKLSQSMFNDYIYTNKKFVKGGGTKQKQKINKKYSHFAVSKEDGKIVDAWETLDDIETLKHYANLDLKDNDLNPRDFNILSGKTLIKRGINPYDSDNWGHFSTRATRYEDGGNIGSMAMAGAMPELAIANEVSKKLPETTSAVDKRIAERIYSDKPSFWEDRGLKHYAGGGGVGQNLKIKDWYTKYRPEDDLGFKLNPNSTFKDLLNAILNGNDVYEVLGVRDSVIRERSFQKLSIIEKKEGQWAYNNWLIYSKNYGKGGNVLATSPTLDGINKLISEYLYGSTITLVPVDSEKKSFEVHNKKGKTQFLVVLNKNKYQFIPSQQYAQGGSVGQQITFKHWSGDIKNGTITEDLGNGDFQVSSGFGNVLVNKEDIISSGTKSPERKNFAGGGGVKKVRISVLSELYDLRDKGVTQVQLNGFNENINYIINLRLNDTEIKKVGNNCYITLYSKGGGVGGSNVGDLILIKCDSSNLGKVTFVVSEAELNKIPETAKSSLTEKAKEFVYEMSEKSNTYNVQYNFQRNVQYYFQRIVTNKILVYKYLKGYNHTEYKITPSPSKDGSFSISTGTYHNFTGGVNKSHTEYNKEYEVLLSTYTDIESDIDYEKKQFEPDYDLISRLNEESNNLYQILNSKYKERFNSKFSGGGSTDSKKEYTEDELREMMFGKTERGHINHTLLFHQYNNGKKDNGFETWRNASILSIETILQNPNVLGKLFDKIEEQEQDVTYPYNSSDPYTHDFYKIILTNGQSFTLEYYYGRPAWSGNVDYILGVNLKYNTLMSKKFAGGGSTNSRMDLFEDYENIPPEVQNILDKYAEEFGDDFGGMDYKDMANMHNEIYAVGYTFDSGLDNMAFGLRPVGVNLNELQGYESEPDDDKE